MQAFDIGRIGVSHCTFVFCSVGTLAEVSGAAAEVSLGRSITDVYNANCLPSRLGSLPPIEFETIGLLEQAVRSLPPRRWMAPEGKGSGMNRDVQTHRTYALGHAAEEIARLEKQAQLRDPSMRWLLAEAGIGPGMKVLDIGSGAGDVAFLAADLVGPSGSVVGVDANPTVLERARERVRATGRANLSFVCGDLHTVALDDDFDAVVGRLILAHQADPAETLRSVTRHLRPGGIVAFQELHIMGEPWDVPPSPLHKQMWDWTLQGFSQAGIDVALGLKLPHVFRDAGLPTPQMHLSAPVSGGPDWPGYDVLAMVFRAALEFAHTHGLATVDEVAALEVETFAARLRDEVVRQNGVITFAPSVGAWARKP